MISTFANQNLQAAANRRQRIAQFLSQGRQKSLLAFVRLNQRLPGAFALDYLNHPGAHDFGHALELVHRVKAAEPVAHLAKFARRQARRFKTANRLASVKHTLDYFIHNSRHVGQHVFQ